MKEMKRLFRAAGDVHEALTSLKHNRYLELMRRLSVFTGKLGELATESRKMGTALARGWLSSAGRSRTNTGRLLNDLSYSISQIRQLAEGPEKEVPLPSGILNEFNQLEQEFGGLDFDGENKSLSVTTEPITLENVALGPFKIRLELNRLSELYQKNPYSVIALNPNPAATDDEVTHPHVSGERLCEGDGCGAIRSALEEGRICDFFMIVRSILNTYSPDSPYVALHDWYGTSCHNCGYMVSSEESYYCDRCEHDFCSECATYCRKCEETVCLGCSVQCSCCEDLFCSSCVGTCASCGEPCCPSCLEDDRCPNCKEEEEYNEERQKQKDQPANEDRARTGASGTGLAGQEKEAGEACTEIQPGGVGKAALLQGQIG